jgi:hypothetical protein
MPIFLDSHQGSDLPLDGIREFLMLAKDARTDDAGVLPLDLYCGDDGRVFYVVAAPDEAAVRRHHARQGVICRQVRRVQSAPTTGSELTDEDKAVVRHMIVDEQTAASEAGGAPEPEHRLRHVG